MQKTLVIRIALDVLDTDLYPALADIAQKYANGAGEKSGAVETRNGEFAGLWEVRELPDHVAIADDMTQPTLP